MKNYVSWCMDSCRWDMFHLADAPYMKEFTNMRMVYSRAAITPPSLFASFMNLSWYESNGAVLIPEIKRWVWVPSELQKLGYHTVFVTSNPMLELYKTFFSIGFNEYIMLKGCTYHADNMVNMAIDRVKSHQNTFIFLLFMETHQPYPNKPNHTQEYLNKNYRPITRQKKSIETIDKEFARLTSELWGTNTDILIFSDHGDLDLKMEGHQGHGPAKFHDKLFEIPYGRKTI